MNITRRRKQKARRHAAKTAARETAEWARVKAAYTAWRRERMAEDHGQPIRGTA